MGKFVKVNLDSQISHLPYLKFQLCKMENLEKEKSKQTNTMDFGTTSRIYNYKRVVNLYIR